MKTPNHLPAPNPETIFYDVPRFPMHDNRSCAIAATRSAIGYFEPDAIPAATELDQVVGRAPNEYPRANRILIHLLERGYEEYAIGPFDSDRYLSEGLAYLDAIYNVAQFTPAARQEFYDYFTPERVAGNLAELADERAVLATQPGYRYEVRQPKVRDVRQLLHAGYLVFAYFRGATSASVHQVLVTGYGPGLREPEVSVFIPGYDESIVNLRVSLFKRQWERTDGIVGVRKLLAT